MHTKMWAYPNKRIKERNVIFKDFKNKIRVALVFPNLYKVGMSNLGYQILYDLLNSIEHVYCERFFLDFERSLETGSELKEFDLIAFSWQFELDAINILKILHRSGIPLIRNRRKTLVIAGGPCSVNPYPLREFVDIFFIGETEVNILQFMDLFSQISKDEISAYSDIPGLYISELDNPVDRVYLKNLDEYHPIYQIMSERAALGESFLLEISRGCKRGCRFCLGGFTTRPFRERSLDNLKEIAEKGIKVNRPRKISILGAGISDHSNIDDVCEYLSKKDLELSIPSLRPEGLTPIVAKSLAKTGQNTITLAPESCERIRNVINKQMTDEELLDAVKIATDAGIDSIKLYFMIGSPTESLGDVRKSAKLIRNMKKMARRMKVSITPMIPKPHTPFQWLPFEDISLLREKIKIFKKEHVQVSVEDFGLCMIQASIALGDESLCRILEKAMHYGGGKGAFRRSFKEEGKDMRFYINEKEKSQAFVWDKINVGVKKSFLRKEYEKAFRGETTKTCHEGCKECGVCGF